MAMIALRPSARQTDRTNVVSPRLPETAALSEVKPSPLLNISTGFSDSTTVVAMRIVIATAATPDRKDLIRGDISWFMIVLLGLCFDPGAIVKQCALGFCHGHDTGAKLT
jgi:hypothetical protein